MSNQQRLRDQPCQLDCPRRCAGCSVDCLDWAKHVQERDADYQHRYEQVEHNNMLADIEMRRDKRVTRCCK